MRIHLDTDLGTTMDDLSALVMLLGWPGVELRSRKETTWAFRLKNPQPSSPDDAQVVSFRPLTGITTGIDPGGRRAGYVRYALGLAGRDDIPVAAGAEVSMTTLVMPGVIPDDERRWPEPAPPAPSSAGSALRMLAAGIEAGSTIVAIGPLTNLALLGVERPDVLARAQVVMMGGWFDPASDGLPAWGPSRDWNIQCDTTAARTVVDHAGDLTVVPLSLTLRAHLQGRHLERLRASGPLGRLLATQAEHQSAERSTEELARTCAALPDDLVAFHHDPLTCAVALGWPGVRLEERRVAPVLDGEVLHFADRDEGRLVRIGTGVDADAFPALWLEAIEAAETPKRSHVSGAPGATWAPGATCSPSPSTTRSSSPQR